MAKTAKTAQTAAKTAIAVTDFMRACGGAQGEGRATAFREDPTEENIEALLDAARKNLRKIAKGGTIKKSKKVVKAEKPAKKDKKDKKAVKIVKSDKSDKSDNSKAIAKLTKRLEALRDKRDATEDKAKRKALLVKIREVKAERAELKA